MKYGSLSPVFYDVLTFTCHAPKWQAFTLKKCQMVTYKVMFYIACSLTYSLFDFFAVECKVLHRMVTDSLFHMVAIYNLMAHCLLMRPIQMHADVLYCCGAKYCNH